MLPPNPDNQPDSSINILIVNNDPAALTTVNASLQTIEGVVTSCVNSAQKALRVLRQQTFDLLVIDVDTPDMDGWRLSRLVRSGILHCRADLPIIITAHTWCERIAEVTARAYDINRLLPLDHINQLPELVEMLTRQQQAPRAKPRLLVIEDEPDTADLIRRLLSSTFDIEFAYEGDTGLRAWQQGRQDLVLLDVMLPRLSGRDVLIEIQNADPNQPVVIMTAHTTIDQAEELMLLGATDFLPKPFRTEQLRKVCDIAIHRDDYLVSNAQFAERVKTIQEREREFRSLYESHHQLLNNLQSVVMELNTDYTIRYLNQAWETMMGYKAEECIGRCLDGFIAPGEFSQYVQFKNKIYASLQHHEPLPQFELGLCNKRKHKLWVQLKVSHSSQSNADILTVCMDNITEKRESQEQLEYLAMHDSLTGLFNRHYFESSLAQFTAESLRNNRHHALVYLDLDHFKVINDTYGHHKGDEVLRELAQSLRKRIRSSDILCRLGGDEFAILLRDIKGPEVHEFARNIQKIVAEFTFPLQEQRINLGSSIGLTLIDGSTSNPEEHLMQADTALYVAKGRGRNLIHQYDPRDNESDELRQSVNVLQKIRKAITEDRMVLYFQPIFDVKNNEVSYYEALVRLREPDGSIMGPHTFIPALELAGEMHLLDRWIIKLAIKALHNFPQFNNIAINLSAQAFKDENLVPTIVENLDTFGVSPDRITFELTESASLFNLHITQKVIADLHQLGCSFSVDDFGSGFSSFAYLKQLPADYIKLDGSFIKNLHLDLVDQSLVKSMIQVVQSLGKKAVAEFVENEQILDILKSMGIDFVQGYHIGHPLPIEKLFVNHTASAKSQ